jgi:hypothetical protein
VDTQATSVLLAVYTDTPAPVTRRGRSTNTSRLSFRTLEAAQTPIKDAWLVTSEHWRNLLCDSEAGCCLPEPLESITDGQLNAELVFRGQQLPKGPRHHLRAVHRTQRIPPTGSVRPSSGCSPESCTPAGNCGQNALTRDGWTDPDTAAELVACFQRPDLRDVMFCNVIDPERPDAEDSGDLLIGQGITPDWDRVDRAQQLARTLMETAPDGYRAPLLTLIGWLSYLKGQSSVAAEHFNLAIEDSPGYRLAGLLEQLVSRGTVAPVAQDADTAYKRHR